MKAIHQNGLYRLGIDTTNNNLCFALIKENHVLYAENNYPFSQAAEQLAYRIDNLFKKFDITVNDISEVVSVVGPGGFSGVRIGTSFVTGLVAGSNINVISLSSLKAAAYSVESPQSHSIIISCLDARREGVYVGVYNSDYQPLLGECVCDTKNLNDLLKDYNDYSYYLSGHGSEIIQQHFLNDNLITPIYQKPLAQEFTFKAQSNDLSHQALYFREADAKLPVKKFLNRQ